jgi:hypothetical protein
VLSFIITLGAGGAAWYVNSSRAAAEMPVLALLSLVRDVRSFHGLDGAFPADLSALQDKVWTPRGKGFFKLSEANHSFVAANYYYLYNAVGPHEANIWAVPLGRYRAQYPTMYVKIRNNESVPTVWQGPALDFEQIKKIYGGMPDAELIALGLKLQESPAAPPAPGQYPPAPGGAGQAAPAQNAPAQRQSPNDSPFRFKM